MPKSRRSKLVSLTKTVKKGRVAKDSMIDEIRNALDQFSYAYVFSVDNMRNSHLKDVRTDWPTSRFFFGKNRVMSIALGQSPETEAHKDLHHLSKRLVGQVGLLLTDSSPDDVTSYFDTFVRPDYARSGFVPSETIVIPEGQVMAGLEPVTHTLEPLLRSLGLPSALKNGKVMNLKPYTLASAGTPLTAEQAHILKLLLMPLAEFKVTVLAYWHDGEVTTLIEPSEEELAAMNKTKSRGRAVRKAAAQGDDGEDGMDVDDEEEEEEDDEDDE